MSRRSDRHRRVALDLNERHWTRTFGEVTVIGSWVGNQAEPCLVLVNSLDLAVQGEPGAARLRPFVIRLSEAFEHDVEDPFWREAALFLAEKAATDMRLEPTLARKHAIAGIIHGLLGDLMKIPPRSDTVIGDVEVRFGNGRTMSGVIAEPFG